MARGATKASSNVWCKARLKRGEVEPKLLSREGAAELANMSPDAIKNTELGLEKCMPVEKAVILADLYDDPSLLNYYCLNECPIGRNVPISSESLEIDRVTVKLLRELRTGDLEWLEDKLLDIAADGEITEDEKPDLVETMKYLDSLSKTVSELRIISEKALKGFGNQKQGGK